MPVKAISQRIASPLLCSSWTNASSICVCPPAFLLPSVSLPTTILLRAYSSQSQKKPKDQRRRAVRTHYRAYDLNDLDKFSLVDAMRYLRAFEVGQDPKRAKYELAVRLFAQKNAPTVKNVIRLPKPVKTDLIICVFAEGKAAEDAKKAGAQIVGTKEIWDQIKKGQINFDKCLCHEAVYPEMMKAKIAPILGPRGLLPNPKTKTVIQNPATAVRDMTGQINYRERMGVIRVAIGQLGFTEQELVRNIKAFMDNLRDDINALRHKTEKRILEVVLSTTRGPGMSLNGDIRSQEQAPLSAAEPGPTISAAIS